MVVAFSKDGDSHGYPREIAVGILKPFQGNSAFVVVTGSVVVGQVHLIVWEF